MRKPAWLYLVIFLAVWSPVLAHGAMDGVIEVSEGEEFSISLASNITTGYQWRIDGPLDETVVALVGNEYVSSSTGNGRPRVGQGGEEIWTFLGAGPGTTTFTMAYARPWEVDRAPISTVSFTINVR
ncbi:MAG: protease inhibitor I42 family protein [Acidobacteriota bacterium]